LHRNKTSYVCQTCAAGKNFLRKAVKPLNEMDNDIGKNTLTREVIVHSEGLTNCEVVNWAD
jgi:hypothetical protein